jgi:phosphatidylserine/phosphatidylglycerophosphate/cardiolipin synthase-like enzyme
VPKGFTGWRDTHARITGEAVAVLQAVFATMWMNATGENLIDERYFPAVDPHVDVCPSRSSAAVPIHAGKRSVRRM